MKITIDKKLKALGAFLTACSKLDTGVKGGKQKLQKILGERIFYQSENGKKWFYNTKALRDMTICDLNKLTEKIKTINH